MYGRFKDHMETQLRQIRERGLYKKERVLLLDEGIYVIGFSYPVAPVGKSRIRVQISAAHAPEQIAFALDRFRLVGRKLGAI